MSLKYRARLQIPLAVCLIVAGLPKEFRAQITMFARVQPNQGRINMTGEIYDPARNTFTAAAGPLFTWRALHTATRLSNGKVLITGGFDGLQYLSTAEIFDPLTGTSAETMTVDPTTSELVESKMTVPRQGHTATLLQNGLVLIVGGYNGTYLSSAELYNPATGVFTQLSSALTTARAYHTATLQFDGQVLIAGGFSGSYLNSLEVFNPTTRTFTQLSPTLSSVRAYHSATLLSDGRILFAGGYDGTNYLNTAMIYDPTGLSIQPLASTMTASRENHTGTLLPNGKVLIAGGFNGSALATAEIFDPATGSFTALSSQMTAARQQHTATLLGNGKVMIAGGGSSNPLATAELYDPSSQTFSAIPSPMTVARQVHTATLLADGRVFLAGGQNGNLLIFDINLDNTDNISPNIIITSDSKRGVVPYTGSGTVLIFSLATGQVLSTITTGGYPAFMTPLSDGHTFAVVAALDNRIFLIDTNTSQLTATLTFSGAQFGFGSIVTVAHNSNVGFISSTGTGEIIKFSLPDGKVLGRLGGLSAPARLTITPDDNTLIAVDAGTMQLVFVNTATMQQKATLAVTSLDPEAVFDIFNNIALSADGSAGIVASRGENSYSVFTVFVFSTSTAAVLAEEAMTTTPGYIALTPDRKEWVILGQSSLFVVPVTNPDGNVEYTNIGDTLPSANIVFSPDSKYAYCASATSDYLLKQNLSSGTVEGELDVGDNPNVDVDQSSSVAITPDGQTIAVLNFISNNIALVTANTVLISTEFVSGPDTYTNVPSFTSLCLVNTSNSTANIQITAIYDYGTDVSGTNITNPVTLTLPPNGQISTTVDQLFGFDGVTAQSGYLLVVSDISQVVGYVSVGQVQGSWLGPKLSRLNGVPLARNPMYDWIVPEITRTTGASTPLNITTELNILNPYYSSSTYDLWRIVNSGSVIEDRTAVSITNSQRISQSFTATYTQPMAGQVLIAGGLDGTTTLNTAETYDPTGLIFTATNGTMNRAVQSQMATVLSDGKVLTAGGKDSGNTIVNYAEVFDPVIDNNSSGTVTTTTTTTTPTGVTTTTTTTGTTFTVTTGAMNVERYRGTATLLQDGRVLIAGGQTLASTTNTAELFDASTTTFSFAPGTMTSPRDSHTATLLANGKVLIAGGSDGSQVVATAELFDPSTGTFTATGNMTVPRAFHTATLLQDGRVLIAGGFNGGYLNTAETYDPSTGTFTATGTSMNHTRCYHTSTLLQDGRVLLTGGTDGSTVTNTAELYDPQANAFLGSSQTMSTARENHAAVVLVNSSTVSDYNVLIFGGTDGTNWLSSADVYTPTVDTFAASSNSMTSPRSNFTATLLPTPTEGYLRVTSTQGLMFSEFYGNASWLAALNGIDMSKYSGITSLYSPQFALVSGFTSILNVINGNTNAAGITITLHDPTGKVIGKPASLTLDPGAQLKGDLPTIFQNDPAIQNVTGWLEVDSTVDLVVGTISFTNASGSFLTSFELQGTPLGDFILPLAAIDSTYHTAMALLNPGASAASVDVELWAPNGTMTRSATLSLPSGSRTSVYLDQVFPNLGSVLVSNIRIHSSRPLFGFGLIHDSDLNFIASMPSIAFPPSK
jgi:deoxycytidylate deaminase